MKNCILIILGMILLINLQFAYAITIDSVYSSPDEVIPGQNIDISLNIENTLEDDVKDIDIILDLSKFPFAPSDSGSEKNIQGLDEGEDELIKFKLICLPEAISGIYKIPVKLNYKIEKGNQTTSYSKEILISIKVGSKPELKVFLESSDILIKKQKGVITLKVINSGLTDIKFLYASLEPLVGISALSEKSQYIGDLDSNDFDSVEYSLQINDVASSTLNLPITLKYKDSTNKEYSETQYVQLKTYSKDEASKLGLIKKQKNFLLILGAFLLLIILLRKKLKKSFIKSSKG